MVPTVENEAAMKILIVHQFYLDRDEGGGSRFNQFAKYWIEAGHEVTVVCGQVHYNTGRKRERFKGKWCVRETDPESGATLLWCHVSESYFKGFWGRFWAFICFGVSGTWAALLKARRPDIVLVTSPPLTVVLTGLLASILRWVPFVFEIRDLMPDSYVDMGKLTNPVLIRIGYFLEWLGHRASRHVNCLTPAFVRYIVERKGVPPEKVSMIPNAADLDLMRPGPRDNWVRREFDLGDRFVITYVGAHGPANKLGQLLDVADRFLDDPDVVFLLVGDGAEKKELEADAARRGLSNVRFLPPQSKRKIGDFLNASDVCTAVLARIDTFKTVYPNKVFDYMACARPILLGIDGVARELVEEAGAGLYVEPENPEEYYRAIEQFRGDPASRQAMGERGRAYVGEHFSRERLAVRYLEVLEGLLGKGDK
jgi:glycosyltransferase involved in cell wall biosynthesis